MIYPVVLCGGSGTRLWPLSRKSYPKQFVLRSGDQTLFQSAASRLSGEAFAEPTFVTASDFRFIVTEQLYELGQDHRAIIIEPGPKNTAPAILAAALQVAAEDENALMLVMPSDHLIPDAQAFEATVMKGVEAAKAGRLVTFGIKPTYAETGYGYLELDGDAESGPVPLKRFVEKPDLPRAEQMLEDGGFLWNAGIFLFSVRAIREAFSKTAPELVSPVTDAVAAAKPDLGFLRLDPEAWERVEDISIDYAVMEKADALTVVPFSGAWSDLGGWDAVWREGDANAAGVVTSGEVTPIDCADSLLRSESDGQELVGIGLSNIIAVAMPDAVLVADRSRAQDVKKAVDALKAKGSKQATAFPRDHRPWGWFDSLVVGDRFQVKRIFVHPGAALSLQSHVHRAEHWIVVSGTARVTVDDDVKLVSENQSIYIPLGAVHRMENPGKVPMVLIEVQTGSYLGEDDIVRYEDVYARS